MLLIIILALAVWAVTATYFLVLETQAKQRCIQYARDKANAHGMSDKGIAYSDMSTVLVLDGKVGY